jgi:hypothetical protein
MKYLKKIYMLPIAFVLGLLFYFFFSSTDKVKEDVKGISLPYSAQHYLQLVANLNAAIVGLGTDLNTIKVVFEKLTAPELVRVHNLYIDKYKVTLATDLRGDLSSSSFFGDTELIDLIKSKYNLAQLTY